MDTTPESLLVAGRYFAVFIAILAVLLAKAIYFLPSIVALSRNMPAALGVCAVNLFLGWTLVGWLVALAWAVSAPAPGHASASD